MNFLYNLIYRIAYARLAVLICGGVPNATRINDAIWSNANIVTRENTLINKDNNIYEVVKMEEQERHRLLYT